LKKDFSNVSKIISISILYFNLGIGDDYIYYGTTQFKGLNTGEYLKIKQREEIPNTLEPKYKMVNKEIFPEYYLITVERYKNIITKRIDEWIYIFKNNEVAEGSTSKNIDQAEQKLAEINMSEEERKRYEKYLVNFMRDNDVLNTARTEGEMKGKMEGKIEVAKNLKKNGVDIEIIIISTGLTKEQIEKL